MFCRYCGAEIEEGSTFCPSCGNPVKSRSRTGAEAPKKREINYALNCNLGFGGHNGTMLFKKFAE